MRPHSQNGSVSLVALCCVAVLGIALASFLAVSSQSMKLSNRGYAKDVSRHLAEMGLERALRSFTNNTYSSWTHPDATTATKTVTITSSHYDNRFSTTVAYVRVDRYNAAIWNAATSYTVNDMVWYRGVWFHCIAGNTNQAPPNTSFWTSAPSIWNADANYNFTGTDIVLYGGNAYRCTSPNSNQPPPNLAYWSSYSVAAWNASTSYAVNDVALLGGTAYRCISANSNQTPPNLNYWISVPVVYSEGVATLADSGSAPIKTQLRVTIAPTPLFPNAAGATTLVTLVSSGTVDSYNSVLGTYNQSTAPFSVGSPNVGFSAVLAGGNTSGTAVNVTSATVKGYVAAPSSSTSPYALQATFGASTAPSLKNADGTVTSPHPMSANVDDTRISRSPFIPQFDIQSISTGTSLPAAAGSGSVLYQGAITLGTVGATTPSIYNVTYTRDTGYDYPGLDLWEPDHDLTIVGPVILNVTGLFNIYQGSITVANTGSLEIYFTGQLDIGYPSAVASAGIYNNTNDPKKLLIVGTNSTNSVNYHYIRTVNPLTGVVYMPNAYITITSNNKAINGALSAKNIRFSSVASLHYDTSLRTAGSLGTFIDAPYMISEWRELTDPAERVTLP